MTRSAPPLRGPRPCCAPRPSRRAVVIGTLLLCAPSCVCGLVGWRCCSRQITDGLVGRARLLVGGRGRPGRPPRRSSRLLGGQTAATSTPGTAASPELGVHPGLARRGAGLRRSCSSGPIDGSSDRAPRPAPAPAARPACSRSSIPATLRRHGRAPATSGRTSYRTPRSATPAAPAGPRSPGRGRPARRSRCRPTAAPTTLYYLFPMTEQQDTLALVRRALVTGGGAAAAPGRRRDAGWSPGRWSPRCGWPRRVAERLAVGPARGAHARARRGRHRPARRPRSTRWPTSLQRQIRQLEELSRVQRRFVSDVSHELRTPLTTVRMAGDVLHDARDAVRPGRPPAPRSCCRPSSTGSRRCSADLLEISRFDAGAAVLDLEDVDLATSSHRVVDGHPAAGRAARRRVVVRAAGRGRASPRSTPAASSGSCATWSPTPSTRRGRADVVVLAGRRRRRPPR